MAEWISRLTLVLKDPGSNPEAGNFFFHLIRKFRIFSTFWSLTEMADHILKLALYQRFPQFLKKPKIWKKMEKVSSRRDLNPDLPIQSQLCLPLDQGFMKIAWKYQKFLTRFFRIYVLDVFFIINHKKRPYSDLPKVQKEIVMKFSV